MWSEQLANLRKLSDDRHKLAIERILRLEDTVVTLLELVEEAKMKSELTQWRSRRDLIQWDQEGWLTRVARHHILARLREQKLVEEKHQGSGKPILYRLRQTN